MKKILLSLVLLGSLSGIKAETPGVKDLNRKQLINRVIELEKQILEALDVLELKIIREKNIVQGIDAQLASVFDQKEEK